MLVVYLAEKGNMGGDQWRTGVNTVKKLWGSKNVGEGYKGTAP